MLPVCSATPTCCFHSQISFSSGLQPLSSVRKVFQVNCSTEDWVASGLSFGNQAQNVSFKEHAAKSLYLGLVKSSEKLASRATTNGHSSPNDLCNMLFSDPWSSSAKTIAGMHVTGIEQLKNIELLSISASEKGIKDFVDESSATTNILSAPVEPENMSSIYMTVENSISTIDSMDTSINSLSSIKSTIDDFAGQLNESISATLTKGDDVIKSTFETVNSLITAVRASVNAEVDNAISGVFTTADKSGEIGGRGLTSLSSDLKDATSKATGVAADLLRHTIVAAEDFVTKGASLVVYSYGSAKDLLPQEVRDTLYMSEEVVVKIFNPVVTALQEGYATIENLERSLGLDPNDPLLPFGLIVATSATLWVVYWVWTYSGYSGDVSPSSALELLRGNENAVLVDVRPEALREKDGIPDLRRVARFRYASVSLPEVDSSIRKLLKSGRDLDDVLTAAVIRGLKIVQDRSKVIVMDASGTHSKGIARSLRRFGVKRSFIIKGGFKAWMKEGLRVKELKPETTLTILNEEAEAILEDINPSPVQLIGIGVGTLTGLYALLEWEKTLQLIGIVGLGQTIYRRIASYEDAEDFKQDMRLLLAPAKVGAQAISWAAGKLETNGVKLPTSPSSTDVQNRVLQAAAKHESQPSDSEGIQDQSLEQVAPPNENSDLS